VTAQSHEKFIKKIQAIKAVTKLYCTNAGSESAVVSEMQQPSPLD
jgi:hypothetical protein